MVVFSRRYIRGSGVLFQILLLLFVVESILILRILSNSVEV
jgi:hypothetical protein